MEQYISKDALVREIEKQRNAYIREPSKYKVLSRIYSFLRACAGLCGLQDPPLGPREKIADEKSHQVYELSIYHYDGQCIVDYVGEIDHDSLYDFSGNTLYEAIEKAWNWLRENAKGG